MPSDGSSGRLEDPLEVAARAEQLRGAGLPEEALALVTEALATHPDSAPLLAELSSARRVLGDLPGAEQAIRAALQQAPQWPVALLRLTIVLVQQNRVQEAVAAAAAVLAVDAESAGGWAYLALARTGLRRSRERVAAREAMRRALELAPDDPTYRYLAAIVEHALGDSIAARILVDEGLSIDPQSPSLLALRAEYAPVAQQPGLLVDVLAANPGDQESRELLDAAVTWERRLALAAATLLPPLVGLVALVGASGVATSVVAALALAGGGLVLLRFRRRRSVLPAGYLAARAAAARGATVVRIAALGAAAAVAAGAVVSWFSPGAADVVVAVAVVAGWVAVLAAMPDDARVLATARSRHGRTRWGTAWRFGGLRQELALWSAIGIGAIGLAGTPSAAVEGTPAPLVALFALVCAAGAVVQLADVLLSGVNAPQGYLRTVAVRYRFVIGVFMVIGLAGLALAGFTTGRIDTTPREEVPTIRVTPLPTVSIPSLGFTIGPVPTITTP